jgi:hypothetical protein
MSNFLSFLQALARSICHRPGIQNADFVILPDHGPCLFSITLAFLQGAYRTAMGRSRRVRHVLGRIVAKHTLAQDP